MIAGVTFADEAFMRAELLSPLPCGRAGPVPANGSLHHGTPLSCAAVPHGDGFETHNRTSLQL